MRTHVKKGIQVSESVLVGTLLGITGGFLDAYSYFNRGEVFANAQSGNMVLLGIHFIQGEWNTSLSYLFPILAFVVGIFICELVRSHQQVKKGLHWRQTTILIEILVLFFVSFLPKNSYDLLANIAISFVSGVQVESFRKVNGSIYATTFCTGNLRSGTEQLYLYMKTKEKKVMKRSLDYFSIILFFILGGILCVVTSGFFFTYSLFFALIPLILVFLLMFKKRI